MINKEKTTKVTTAVILAAGLGTRMAPITMCIPKVLLPIGKKPALNYLLEEVETAGITDVVIVVNPAHKKLFKHYLYDETVDDGWRELRAKFNYKLVVQKKPTGAADAILCAEAFVGKGQPFVVMNGDDVYTANGAKDLIEAYIKSNNVIGIAVREVEKNKAGNYGIALCKTALNKHGYEMLDFMVEKPTMEQLDELNVPETVKVVAGRYVFTDAIFGTIRFFKEKGDTDKEKILQEAINVITDLDGNTVLIKKTEFDIGNEEGYVKAIKVLTTIDKLKAKTKKATK